jgi:hypothetical protein
MELDMSSNRKLIQLDFLEKNNLGFSVYAKGLEALEGVESNLFDKEFQWLTHFEFRIIETNVPDKVTGYTHPFMALVYQYERLVRMFDVSSNAISGTLNLGKLFASLRDEGGRRDITQEQLFRELSDPKIFISQDNIIDLLVSYGYSTAVATSTANSLHSRMNFFLFAQNSSSSLEDAFIPNLRISPEAIDERVIFLNGFITNGMLRDLIKGASLGLIIGLTGLPISKSLAVQVIMDGHSEVRALKSILGANYQNEYDWNGGQIEIDHYAERWKDVYDSFKTI